MSNPADTGTGAADEPVPAAGPPFDVFISHATGDRATAARLRDALLAAGLRPWTSFTDIPLGAPYPVRIDRALLACRAVALLVSRASMGSEHVFREITQASSAKKPILPIYLEPDVPIPEGPRYYLQSLHRIKTSPDAIESAAPLIVASIEDHDVWLREAPGPGLVEKLSATPVRTWYRAVGGAVAAGLLVWAMQIAWQRYDDARAEQQRDALPESLAMLNLISAERKDAGKPWRLQFKLILADSRTRFSDLTLTLHKHKPGTAGTDMDLTDVVRNDQVGGGRMYEVTLAELDEHLVACLTLPHPRASQRWRLSTPFKTDALALSGSSERVTFQQSGVPVASPNDASPCGGKVPATAASGDARISAP